MTLPFPNLPPFPEYSTPQEQQAWMMADCANQMSGGHERDVPTLIKTNNGRYLPLERAQAGE